MCHGEVMLNDEFTIFQTECVLHNLAYLGYGTGNQPTRHPGLFVMKSRCVLRYGPGLLPEQPNPRPFDTLAPAGQPIRSRRFGLVDE